MAKKNAAQQGPETDTDGVPDLSGGESTPPAAPAAEPADTAEGRIREAAERKLEERTGDLAVRLTKAEARANGLEGELEREREARKAAEQRISALEVELAAARTAAHNAGQKLEGLPDGAYQLNECVTIASTVPGKGKGGRLHAKQNDVLFVTRSDDEVADLQRALGLQTTVYRVDAKTIEDLQASGFLHS